MSEEHDEGLLFDTDSYPIAVDNCASYTMTNDESDFIDTPVTVQKSILGIGSTKALKQGTVRWSIQDDQGAVDYFTIPNTFYVPDLPIRLLSPQHWSQANDHLDAHSDTDAHRITLEWGNHIKTIPLNTSNVGVFRSTTGYNKAKPVLQALTALLHEEQYCTNAHLIPPDDEPSEEPSNQESTSLSEAPHETPIAPTTFLEGGLHANSQPHEIDFDLEQLPLVEDDTQAQQDQVAFDNPSAQLLHWHYRLGHVPFRSIQAMAHQGRLPKALANC
jgi:hypothetical protein